VSAVEAALWAIWMITDALAYVLDALVMRLFPHGSQPIDWPDVRRRVRRHHRTNRKHPSLRF
jgi:hypothetical protein